METLRQKKVFFAFGGLGGFAIGAQRAEMHLGGRRMGVKVIGGVDIDAAACANFEMFTGVKQTCADITTMTVLDLERAADFELPDIVVITAPCKGSTKLITDEKAEEPHYQALNQLAIRFLKLALAAGWRPAFWIFENVPNVTTRARKMIAEMKKLLRSIGCLFSDDYRNLGEDGGLAQQRLRWIMVARDPEQVPGLLYQPPKKRIRACGEVIAGMPLPNDPNAGPLFALPEISWINWLRLANIPPDGDHRDLPGVLAAYQARREVFRRYHLSAWTSCAPTLGGPGTNGPYGLCDVRLGCEAWAGAYGVKSPGSPADCITAHMKIDNRPAAIAVCAADLLPQKGNAAMHWNKYGVRSAGSPAGAVIGATRVGSGAPSFADPMPGQWFGGALGVVSMASHAGTITSRGSVTTGAFACADLRVPRAFDKAYGVVGQGQAHTIACNTAAGCGAYAFADTRRQPIHGGVGLLSLDEAMRTTEEPGPWAVYDRCAPFAPLITIGDPKRPPSAVPVILSRWNTWNRPFVDAELMALQSIPWQVDGKIVRLAGSGHTSWREQIGNAFPPDAAEAFTGRLLMAFLEADLGAFSLSGAGGVWVDRPEAGALQ